MPEAEYPAERRCQCGNVIPKVKYHPHNYCSPECRREGARLRASKWYWENKAPERLCLNCSTPIPAGSHHARRYCDAECRRVDRLRKDRDWRLRREYGITLATYEGMLEAQGGVCALCGNGQSSSIHERLAVDHCHETGRVRGLLCNGCNTSLGHFGDDPKRLQAAIDYLGRS